MKLLYESNGNGISLRAESSRDIALLGRLSVKTKTEVSTVRTGTTSDASEIVSLRLHHEALLCTLLELAAK